MHMFYRVALLGIVVAPLFVWAQGLGIVEELVVTITPERPGANERVEVSVESYTADISGARISFFINDTLRVREVGQKNFTFVTGPSGTPTKFAVVVETLDGRLLQKEFTLKPADVTLLWQANGYTPPFYKGKGLFPFQGTVVVAAIPSFLNTDGSSIPAESLVYTWKEDGKVIGDASGYGQSTFFFKGGVPMRTKVISVEVNTTDNTMLASAFTEIEPVRPRIILYENNPIYGIQFLRPLRSPLALDDIEVRLSAIPFFFEAGRRADPLLSYSWQANYNPLPAEKKPDIILRRTSEEGGSANVSLSVQHSENDFEASRASLEITFEQRAFSAPVSSETQP